MVLRRLECHVFCIRRPAAEVADPLVYTSPLNKVCQQPVSLELSISYQTCIQAVQT